MVEPGTVETPAPPRTPPSPAPAAPAAGDQPVVDRSAPPAAAPPGPGVRATQAGDTPDGSTRAWILSRVLLVVGVVLLALSAFSAFHPVSNPGVQECGGAVPFLVLGGDNRLVHEGDTGQPNEDVHAHQPTCRDRAIDEAGRAGRLFAAFVLVTALGAVIGLLDDHAAHRREPAFETYLRDLPYEGRARRGLVPRVTPPEVAAHLPPLEGPEVIGIVVASLVALVALPFAGPWDATMAALAGVHLAPLVAALAVMAATWAVAALVRARLLPRGPRPTPLSAEGEAALEAVAGSWEAALRPLTGSAGIDLHHQRRRGVSSAEAQADVQVLVTVSLVLHLVLLAPLALVVALDRHPPTVVREPQLALIGAVIVLVALGLCRVRTRWRGLPVQPSPTAFIRFDGLAPTLVDRSRALGLVLAQPLLRALVLVLVLAAFGARPPVLVVALVALLVPVAVAVAPTPGGAGTLEAVTMLLLMLVAGVDPGQAACAALTLRVLTYWLPMVPGLVAARRLRRIG